MQNNPGTAIASFLASLAGYFEPHPVFAGAVLLAAGLASGIYSLYEVRNEISPLPPLARIILPLIAALGCALGAFLLLYRSG